MKQASQIRHDIHVIERDWPYTSPKLAQMKHDLVVATRRENKRLADTLTHKADVYGPTGRIYSFEHKWSVAKTGELLLDGTVVNPSDLRDGHGRLILPSGDS